MARDVNTKISATDNFSQVLETLQKQLTGVVGTLSQVGKESEKQTSMWDRAKSSLQTVGGAFSRVGQVLSSGIAPIARNKKEYGKLSKTIELQRAYLKELAKEGKKGNAVWNQVTKSIALNEKQLATYQSRSLKRMIKMTGQAITQNVALGKRFRALKHSIEVARISTDKWDRANKTAGAALSALRGGLSLYGKGIKKSAELTAEFYKKAGGAGLKVMSQGLSLIGQRLVRINEGFGRIAGGGLKALKQGISDILRGGLQRLVETVRDFSIASIKQFADLELSMKKINIFGNLGMKSDEEFKILQNSLERATKDSLFSMEEISSAFESVAAIGDFADEGVKGLTQMGDAVVDMATATGEADLAKTAEVLSTTMNAFGLEAEDAMHTASILTKIANDSALSVNSLGDALGYVAGTAAFAGMGLEETGAALAVLSNQGLSASKSGTALNQALQKMTRPTAGATDLMNELGISFFDAQGELKSFEQIIPELSNTLAGLETEEEKLAVLGELFGVRGKRAIAALLNDFNSAQSGVSDFSDLFASLEGIEPVPKLDPITGEQLYDDLGQPIMEFPVEIQADEMMDTLAGSMARLEGSLEVMKSTFGEILAPAIGLVADSLTRLTENEAVMAFMETLATVLAEVITQLEPLILILMEAFMPVLNALIPVIQLVAQTITKLFTAGSSGMSVFDTLIAILLLVIDVVIQLFNAFMPLIMLLMGEIVPIILLLAEAFVTYLLPVILEVINALMPFIMTLIPLIKMLAKTLISLMPIIQFVLRLFVTLAQKLMTALMPVLIELIKAIIDNSEFLKTLIVMIGMAIQILIMFMPIIELVSKILVILIKVISWLLQMFGKLVSFILDGVIWVFDKLLGVISSVIGAMNDVLDMVGLGSDSISDFTDSVDKAREEIRGMKADLEALAEVDPNIADDLNTDLAVDLEDNISDGIVDGLEEGTDATFDQYTFPEDTFDDSDVEIDTESLETAADDIAESVLSGTSVQDIIDLGELTGITPTDVGPTDPLSPNDGGTNNNYTITVEGDIIIEGSDGETTEQDVAQEIAEILLGSGGGGQRRYL